MMLYFKEFYCQFSTRKITKNTGRECNNDFTLMAEQPLAELSSIPQGTVRHFRVEHIFNVRINYNWD